MVNLRRAGRAASIVSQAAKVVAIAGVMALTAGIGGDALARSSPSGKSVTAKAKPSVTKAAAKKSAAKTATSRKPMSAIERRKAAAKKEKARIARIIRAAGPPPPVKKQYDGVASFYTRGKKTASGGRYNPGAMTAAHRSLPFGTKVRVIDKRSGRAVTVTINDRGPFKRGRVIDLSRAAARAIGMSHRGVTRVRVTVLNSKRG
jgi:rare lipoprotein A